MQSPNPAGKIEGRDEPSTTTKAAMDLEKRKGGGGGKGAALGEDAEYTGSFGGLGLMGLGGGGLGVGTISTGALLVMGGVAVALILAMAGYEAFIPDSRLGFVY